MSPRTTIKPSATAAALPRTVVAVTVAIALAWLVLLPGSARADFEVESFSFANADQFGGAFTQAGGHPYENATSFEFPATVNGQGDPIAEANVKTTKVDLPPGLIANPQAYPHCTEAELVANSCPSDSQVGTIVLTGADGGTTQNVVPVSNMLPARGQPAQFGFTAGIAWVHLYPSVHPDGSLTVNSDNISQLVATAGIDVRFWGVPGDPSHDAERRGPDCGEGCASGVGEVPFLRMPTSCTGPQPVTLHAESWQDPGNFVTATVDAPANTGCASLAFDSQVSAQPTTNRSGAPSDIDFSIEVDPGLTDPNGTSASDLKGAVVTLPEGTSVNPSSADGLEACTQAEVAQETPESDFGEGCPAASKIGSVEVETPLLEENLAGSVFLADPDDNPFDTLLAGYIVIKSAERGVAITLPGRFDADPDTGQITAEFDNNPELPFSRFDVHFKTGDRAPLALPEACGIYEISAELTPHSGGAAALRTDTFTIDSGPDGGPCLAGDPNQPADPADLADRPFEPGFNAGVKDAIAGLSDTFTTRITRPDGHQELDTVDVSTPQGITGKLAGVELCPEADVATHSCGPASQIGTEIAGAGAGPTPFYTTENPGKVFLAGPYDPDGAGPEPEAPLSMVITEPVIAGPFDLDDVSVRAALNVDPATAEITVASDPIPKINSGIPLRIRDLRIRIDREGFMRAPTDCDPKQVGLDAVGSHGAEYSGSVHFQVRGCGDLDFGPKLTFKTDNNDATSRSDHPALDSTVAFNHPADAFDPGSTTPQEANIAKAVVTLPPSIILDQDSLETICTREDYANEACPANTQYGTTVAESPLLDEPLEGPVYLRASDNPLPDLVADLNGIIDIDLVGEIDQTGGQNSRLRTTFSQVPDVAVGGFNLKLNGGANGLLVNSQNVCASKDRRTVDVKLYGQSNQTAHQSPRISIPACVKAAKKDARKLKRKARKAAKKARKLKRKARRASGKKARKLKRKSRRQKRKAKKLKRQAKRAVRQAR